MFGLSPRVFIAKPVIQIGELSALDDYEGITITAAGIDSDNPYIYGLFSVEFMEAVDGIDDTWYVVWNGGELAEGVERYDVPVYVEYVTDDGEEGNWKGSFVVYAKGQDLQKPTVQYIENLATKVGSTEYVTIYGYGFNDDLEVFLDRPNDSCVMVPDSELYRSYGEDGNYDTISFMFGKPYVALDTKCHEICGTYGVNLGYGTCDAPTIEAGTSDASTAWNNNLYLIRYRYDSENRAASEQTPGGSMVTVDPSCFYSTDIELVTDDYDSDGKTPADGGVMGSLGKDIYFRIKPDTDCTKLGYYRVRLKYSMNLPRRAGKLTLDGVRLNEGDIVWLDKQFDGGDGLWIVQTGDWVGLKSYLDGQSGGSKYDPCNNPVQEPLPVDSGVIADLGVRVKDRVTVTCDSDVPSEMRYGSQRICSTLVRPGDTVLLTNQSEPGTNGLWEVTCAEWLQRTDTVPAHSGTTISGDDFVVVQNDIDFCTCEHSGKNIFHIWYYYLNGACYLARASRAVKITCGAKGSLFPSSGVDVTDYRITAEADPELVRDTLLTAGDPVRETCMEKVENYDADHRVSIDDTGYGCGQESIVAPNGMPVCRCKHVYSVDKNIAFSSRDRNGFSIVFWQYGEDEKWHLYAYVGSGRYDTGMNYYVYHLCTSGIATDNDIDVNTEVLPYGDDGRPTDRETRDAWFVSHGGKLSTGFGLFDDTWNFKVYELERDSDGNVLLDESGNPVRSDSASYSHVLNADTLYSNWSIKCTTTLCAARVYRDSSILRTKCSDMSDVGKTSSVMLDVIPTPDTWGFKFYNEAIGKSRLCDIWNSMRH